MLVIPLFLLAVSQKLLSPPKGHLQFIALWPRRHFTTWWFPVFPAGLLSLKLHPLSKAPPTMCDPPRGISIWSTTSQLVSNPITGVISSQSRVLSAPKEGLIEVAEHQAVRILDTILESRLPHFSYKCGNWGLERLRNLSKFVSKVSSQGLYCPYDSKSLYFPVKVIPFIVNIPRVINHALGFAQCPLVKCL